MRANEQSAIRHGGGRCLDGDRGSNAMQTSSVTDEPVRFLIFVAMYLSADLRSRDSVYSTVSDDGVSQADWRDIV